MSRYTLKLLIAFFVLLLLSCGKEKDFYIIKVSDLGGHMSLYDSLWKDEGLLAYKKPIYLKSRYTSEFDSFKKELKTQLKASNYKFTEEELETLTSKVILNSFQQSRIESGYESTIYRQKDDYHIDMFTVCIRLKPHNGIEKVDFVVRVNHNIVKKVKVKQFENLVNIDDQGHEFKNEIIVNSYNTVATEYAYLTNNNKGYQVFVSDY